MLTGITEGGKAKCDQYWPDTGSAIYDQFEVTAMEEPTEVQSFVMRKLKLTRGENSKKSRIITHVHVLAWGDYSVPGTFYKIDMLL